MDYERFFELLPAAGYVSTPDGSIVGCNSSFLKLFGFSSVEEARLNGMTSLFPDKRSLSDLLRKLDRTPVYLGQRLQRIDGTSIYAMAGATGVFDEQQRLAQIVGFFLEESQVRVAKKALADASRVEPVVRLAATIAESFDNLLRIASFQFSGVDTAPAPAHVRDTIRESSYLLKQLLAFSQMQRLQPAPTNLNTLVWRLRPMIVRNLRAGTELIFELAEDLGATMVDQLQMEHVILSLVTNAGDAMPVSGRMVFTTTNVTIPNDTTEPQRFGDSAVPGAYTVISVNDNGIGMDKAVLDSAFDPFFSTKWRGRGLGLSAVVGIINQSNGFVQIQTAPDRGTTVFLFLPRTEEEISHRDTVLVVEGEEFLRQHIKETLKRCGYTVLTAGNGPDALQLAAGHGKIDVLVTEFATQDMSGSDLAKRLIQIRPGLPIVFLATAIDLEASSEVEQLQATVIKKPFLLTTVVATIRALLNPVSESF